MGVRPGTGPARAAGLGGPAAGPGPGADHLPGRRGEQGASYRAVSLKRRREIVRYWLSVRSWPVQHVIADGGPGEQRGRERGSGGDGHRDREAGCHSGRVFEGGAASPPPGSRATPFSVRVSGVSYSSNSTPRLLICSTAARTSVTWMTACVNSPDDWLPQQTVRRPAVTLTGQAMRARSRRRWPGWRRRCRPGRRLSAPGTRRAATRRPDAGCGHRRSRRSLRGR
jgi:hypothetical protein